MPAKPSAAELKGLEQLLAEQAPTLQKTAPKQLKAMEELVKELKASPNGEISAASQKTLKQLFVWQVDLKRADYQKQIEGLTKVAKTDPEAAKALKAMKIVLQVLDEAKRAVNAPASTSAAAIQKMEAASERATHALIEAGGGAADPDATPPPLPVAGVLKKPAPKPAAAPGSKVGSNFSAPSWVNAPSSAEPKKPKK